MIEAVWRRGAVLALVALLVLPIVATGAVPERSEAGLTLVVPEEQMALGDVYHATPTLGTQFVMTSDAPLLRTVYVCNRIAGYVVSPFDIEEGDNPLVAGAFRVPVASLRSGAADADARLRGPQSLNAAEYPEILIEITGASDVVPVEAEGSRQIFTLNVALRLQAKDRTAEVTAPMRLTLAPFTWGTARTLGMADMALLRGSFEIDAGEVGLAPDPRAADFSAAKLTFDLYLPCSAMSPELSFDTDFKREHYCKQLRFLTLLRDFRDAEKAYALARDYAKEIWDDAQTLNRLASAVLTEPDLEPRDLGFVLKVAERANELTEHKDVTLLGTLAQACAERGDLAAAVKWARQGVELAAKGTPAAAQAQAVLAAYEAQLKAAGE
ncbi:MAG: YceI family protein [Phycisphaerae bacterium]